MDASMRQDIFTQSIISSCKPKIRQGVPGPNCHDGTLPVFSQTVALTVKEIMQWSSFGPWGFVGNEHWLDLCMLSVRYIPTIGNLIQISYYTPQHTLEWRKPATAHSPVVTLGHSMLWRSLLSTPIASAAFLIGKWLDWINGVYLHLLAKVLVAYDMSSHFFSHTYQFLLWQTGD